MLTYTPLPPALVTTIYNDLSAQCIIPPIIQFSSIGSPSGFGMEWGLTLKLVTSQEKISYLWTNDLYGAVYINGRVEAEIRAGP